ncbi:MAG: hypothetical protein Q6K99_07305, partial [Thermostichales cyanobacterium BF4_bins_65]
MNRHPSSRPWLQRCQQFGLGLMLGLLLWQGAAHAATPSPLSYGRFLRYIDENRVTQVQITNGGLTAEVVAKDADLEKEVRYRVNLIPSTAAELVNTL